MMDKKSRHRSKSKRVRKRGSAIVLFAFALTLFTASLTNAGTVSYDYDDAGRLVKADYGNGKVIEYTYDNAGNLLSWSVTGRAPPNITSYAPKSPVNDTVCTWRTFNVTVNQTVNVNWYLNGTLLFTNESAWSAKCTLHANVTGEHNITAIASNANGTDMQTWVWNVRKAADLVITGKWLCWPDNCTICYNVTNIGDGTAPACHNTTLYVDGVEVAHDHVPVDLAPGGSYIGCFNGYEWGYTPPSDDITVCADNNEALDELDEDNNCLANIWMCGDVTGDGRVRTSDGRRIFRHLTFGDPIDNLWAADVTGDGRVRTSDGRRIFRHLTFGVPLNCKCSG